MNIKVMSSVSFRELFQILYLDVVMLRLADLSKTGNQSESFQEPMIRQNVHTFLKEGKCNVTTGHQNT